MAKEVNLQATATKKSSAQDEKQKNFETMVKYEKLSQYGNTYQGLCIETYAVCKAYAYLKVIALDAGWDNEPLFQKLLPMFIDEAKDLLAKMNNEKNV